MAMIPREHIVMQTRRTPHAEDHVQYLIRLQEAARDAINVPQEQHCAPRCQYLTSTIVFGPRLEIFTEPRTTPNMTTPSTELWVKLIDGKHYYYIRYPAEDDTWGPEENLTKETLDLWRNSVKTRQTSPISQR
jgi:hypothetical protein